MDNKTPQNNQKFKDARSKKVIIVAHCVLNQNARIDTCALAPSASPKVPEYLLENKVGIIQWPCLELNFLGLGRHGQDCRVLDGSYRHQDGEVYDQLSVPEGRRYLKGVADNLVFQIKEYLKYDFRVLGVLGIPGSPTCGVELKYYKGMKAGNGVFIEELINGLEANDINIPIRGIYDLDPERSLAIVKDLINAEV
jgi:predicted secreted protein